MTSSPCLFDLEQLGALADHSAPLSSVLGPVPLRECALLWEQEKAPRQLDHPAADAGVARLGEPSLSPAVAALPAPAAQARSAGAGSSIAPATRKNLLDQHVRY